MIDPRRKITDRPFDQLNYTLGTAGFGAVSMACTRGYSLPQIALIAFVLLRLSLKATVEIYDLDRQAASRIERRRNVGFPAGSGLRSKNTEMPACDP